MGLAYSKTEDQAADMFTKSFSLCKFLIFEEDAGSLQTPRQGIVLRMCLCNSVKVVLVLINQISYSAVSRLVSF